MNHLIGEMSPFLNPIFGIGIILSIAGMIIGITARGPARFFIGTSVMCIGLLVAILSHNLIPLLQIGGPP
jgi:hypothetical protein